MATDEKVAPQLRLRVTATAEKLLRAGHPWVFADSVRESSRSGAVGDLTVIYDRRDRFLAIGLLDPDSPIRVRVLHAGKPQRIDQSWWQRRLQSAIDRRGGLFDEETTGFRWINGESDGWPGVVLDRYGSVLVLKLYTGAWFPRLDQVTHLITENFNPATLVLRLSRNLQTAAAGWRDGEVLHGDPLPGPTMFLESGLCFEADVIRGQKTGFFLDQRENRRRVGELARGRRVLNAFSFSGGFSLYAARGGAPAVTDLDISVHALAGARRNFALNQHVPGVAACRHGSVQADTFDWLAARTRAEFDLVILDPPSLARREAERVGAVRAYERLAGLGIRALAPGGILLACSCSAHVTKDEFFSAVRRAAGAANRRHRELQTAGHAPDHPAAFKEAEYLKAIYFQFLT